MQKVHHIWKFVLLIHWCFCIISMYINEVCSLVINVMIHKIQDFVNWFCTSTTGPIGIVEYTSFKYFPIIIKRDPNDWLVFTIWTLWVFAVVNSRKYEDLIILYPFFVSLFVSLFVRILYRILYRFLYRFLYLFFSYVRTKITAYS